MIKRLLLLNGLSIFGVVCSHAAQWVWIAMFWWTDRYRLVTTPNYDQFGTLPYYGVVVLQKLGVFAVPAFLFTTGFFVAYANRGNSTISWKIIGNRLKTFLVPYAIWSIVIFIGDYVQGIVYTPVEYLRRLALGDAIPTYWYVFVLFQLYLLAPFLIPLARNKSRPLLIATALMLLGVIVVLYGKLYFHLAGVDRPVIEVVLSLIPGRSVVRWFFFFSLGLVAGFHLPRLKEWLVRARWRLLALAILSFPLAVIETEWIFQTTGMDWRGGIFTLTGSLYAVSTILAFLSFDKVDLPLAKVAYNWGRASFGIYLLHRPVLEFSARFIQRFTPLILAYPVLFQLILVALAAGVPMLMMVVIAKSPARWCSRYLFG